MRGLSICLSLFFAQPGFAQVPIASVGDVNEADQRRELSDGTALRGDDLRRLAEFSSGVAPALLAALAEGEAADVDAFVAALRGGPLSTTEAMAHLVGDWQCSMIKTSATGLPIIAYPAFACRADASGNFEKLTGSQRTKGRVQPFGDRLIYTGTGFVAGDTPPDYTDLPAEIDTAVSPQRIPEIGIVEITAPDHGRIVFPRPYLESELNILTLSR